MRRALAVRTITFAAVLGIGACSNGGTSGGSGSGDGSPSARAAAAFCEMLEDCPYHAVVFPAWWRGLGKERCASLLQGFGGGAELQKRIDSGEITFHEEAFADCLAKIAACDPVAILEANPCAGAPSVTGTVAIGEPCLLAQECASGLCNIDKAGPPLECEGACAEPEGIPDEHVTVNADEKCGFLPGASESGGALIGECPVGYSCDNSTQACKALPAVNEACSPFCAAGLGCVGGACLQIELAEGSEPCDGDLGTFTEAPLRLDVFRLCDPFEKLACIDGTCSTFTDGAAGSLCRAQEDCAKDLFCDLALDRPACTARRKDGQPCYLPTDCASLSCACIGGDCACSSECTIRS